LQPDKKRFWLCFQIRSHKSSLPISTTGPGPPQKSHGPTNLQGADHFLTQRRPAVFSPCIVPRVHPPCKTRTRRLEKSCKDRVCCTRPTELPTGYGRASPRRGFRAFSPSRPSSP
jgi:hypothetical protein